MKFKKILFLIFILLTNISCLFSQTKKEYIQVKNKKIKVEIADNDFLRKKGLMFRKKLSANEGMLFIFKKEGYYSFWMKNTYIPLSIAFISKDKEILEIRDMEPLDETTIHHPLYPIKYALEMNKNWFKKNKIKPGDKIKLPKKF